MLQLERQKDILKILSERKNVTVKELCSYLYASPATIRRDLHELENEGLITRSFGGAVLNEVFPHQVPASIRENENAAEKKKLAAKAAKLILPGETILIDGSTTTFWLAPYLKQIPDITVITNNPKLSLALSEYCVRNFSTGGEMLSESMILVGTQAEHFIRSIRAHKFFFSARGIQEGYITDSCVYQCGIKQTMLACSEKSYFLCGNDKFGHTYPHVITATDNITGIIRLENDSAFQTEI